MARAWPWFLAVAAFGHPAMAVLARWDWRADMLVHLQEPALALTLLASLAVWRRSRRAAIGLLALAAWQAWPIVRYWGMNPVPPDPAQGERLRVLMANVLVDNPDHNRLAGLIHRERPDVVGLVEFTPTWLAGLEAVRREFPYRVEFPAGASGLALWSRRPLRATALVQPWHDGWPAARADVSFSGRWVRIWVVHPSSPLRRLGAHRGFPELDALGRSIGRDGGTRLVVGDLNTTDRSPHFADFERATGLRDSRFGFGLQPSWPAFSPYRIAIDHAFLSADLAVAARRLGPPIGSDHLPLLLEVAPAASRSSEARASQEAPSP